MKLYVIGIGPGDPELITLKGYKILQRISLLFYPTGGRETLALSIVQKLIDLKDKILVELYFPMQKSENLKTHWQELSETLYSHLKEKKEGAFITIGDPAFYSSFFYLKPLLEEKKIAIEIIPGISSFSSFSAKLTLPLTLNQEEALITSGENLTKDVKKYTSWNTLILMKIHKNLYFIKDFAKKNNFLGWVGKRIGHPEEKIWYNLDNIKEKDLDYFSLILLKKNKW